MALFICMPFHEFAHGFVSYKLGDPSPRRSGRLSLNPLHHLDPIGTLALIFFGFGWAKPVMVDPRYYEDKKSGMVKVALAGPVMNFLLALVFTVVYCILIKFASGFILTQIGYIIFMMIQSTIIVNIGLGVGFVSIDLALRNHDSYLSAVLKGSRIPEGVYYNLVNQVNNNVDVMKEYFKLLKDESGIEDFKYYDSYISISSLDKKFDYETQFAIVKDALALLGDEYVSLLDKAYNERWIDVYPSDTKSCLSCSIIDATSMP